jgi:hypothetical protein
MTRILLGGAAVLAALAAIPFVLMRSSPSGLRQVDVELKLTDKEYQPLPGVPLRVVLGTADWQSPDAGTRIVTAEDGTARFTTEGVIDRRWKFVNIGFTPFSRPYRADHIAVAAELEFVLPKKDGADVIYRWLYNADIDRLPDGTCSTYDLDAVYEADADGRFTRLISSNAAGPNFNAQIDGWVLSSAGYKLWDFTLDPPDTEAGRWHLKLGLMRFPKPLLP